MAAVAAGRSTRTCTHTHDQRAFFWNSSVNRLDCISSGGSHHEDGHLSLAFPFPLPLYLVSEISLRSSLSPSLYPRAIAVTLSACQSLLPLIRSAAACEGERRSAGVWVIRRHATCLSLSCKLCLS